MGLVLHWMPGIFVTDRTRFCYLRGMYAYAVCLSRNTAPLAVPNRGSRPLSSPSNVVLQEDPQRSQIEPLDPLSDDIHVQPVHVPGGALCSPPHNVGTLSTGRVPRNERKGVSAVVGLAPFAFSRFAGQHRFLVSVGGLASSVA